MRHDFINHVQVMTALLADGQKDSLARYAEEIKEQLENENNPEKNLAVAK